MDRERMKELAEAQTIERIAQTKIVHGDNYEDIFVNERQYKLVANYRDAYNDDRLAARFSEFLEKYDFIVGDIASDQLRMHGLYQDGKTGVSRNAQISALQDYLFEDINFGAPYFILENLDPHEVVEEDDPAMHKPHHRTGRKHNGGNKNNEGGPVIGEKRKPVKAQKNFRDRKPGKAVTKGNNRKRRFEIRERQSHED